MEKGVHYYAKDNKGEMYRITKEEAERINKENKSLPLAKMKTIICVICEEEW